MFKNYKKFKSEHGNVCYYCSETIKDKNNITVDHLIPKSKGGSSEDDNLVIACRRCNNKKGSMDEDQYKLQLKQKKEIYKIPIYDIKIPYLFKQCGVKEAKINKVVQYYNNYGKFDKPIKLESVKKKTLVDGYSRYLAAVDFLNIKEVPVTYAG